MPLLYFPTRQDNQQFFSFYFCVASLLSKLYHRQSTTAVSHSFITVQIHNKLVQLKFIKLNIVFDVYLYFAQLIQQNNW